MDEGQRRLLLVDAIVNLAIGAVLLMSPLSIIELLGLPVVSNHFYAMILGAVLFGIGIALLLELKRTGGRLTGLGIAGAIAINFCAGLALVAWLIFGGLEIPLRGQVILWVVAAVVLIVAWLELASKSWRNTGGDA
jgi:hypothetical protein